MSMEYTIRKLRTLTSLITKGTTPSNIGESFTDDGVMYFRSELLGKQKYVDKSSGLLFISEETHNKLKRSQIKSGDLLFSMAGYLGRSSLVSDKDVPANTNQAVAIIRFLHDVCNIEYVYYYMSQKWFIDYVCSLSAQTAQPNINLEQIGKLKINIPDRKLQNRIASILSAYDSMIDVNNKRIKVLEQMAENLYKEWFVRFRFPGHESAEFDGGIPKGWIVKKVRDVVKRLPFGTLYKTANTEPEGKVIVIDQSQDEYVGFHNNEPSHIATPEKPIILFGDHSCKYQLMITPFSLSENIVPFVGCSDVLTTYLFYLIRGIVETTEYKRHWTEFVAKKVLVAPFDLQKRFVDYLLPINVAMQKLKEENWNLSKQRDLLLPRLMSGKLEV